MLFADKKRSLNFLTILVGVLMAVAVILLLLNPRVVGPWSGEIEDFSLCLIFIVGAPLLSPAGFCWSTTAWTWQR